MYVVGWPAPKLTITKRINDDYMKTIVVVLSTHLNTSLSGYEEACLVLHFAKSVRRACIFSEG